jgi:hypothetical protein
MEEGVFPDNIALFQVSYSLLLPKLPLLVSSIISLLPLVCAKKGCGINILLGHQTISLTRLALGVWMI